MMRSSETECLSLLLNYMITLKEVLYMATYYLAVDIGASSGRLILGHLEDGRMILEEIYRFENGMVKKDGELCWEFDRIFRRSGQRTEKVQRDRQDPGQHGRGYLGR